MLRDSSGCDGEPVWMRTIDERRPCVTVIVGDEGRLKVLQYIDGRLSASYAPRDLGFTLAHSLPQALQECLDARALSLPIRDPA